MFQIWAAQGIAIFGSLLFTNEEQKKLWHFCQTPRPCLWHHRYQPMLGTKLLHLRLRFHNFHIWFITNRIHVLCFCNFHIWFVRNRIKIKQKNPTCIFSLQHSHPVCHKQDKKNQVKKLLCVYLLCSIHIQFVPNGLKIKWKTRMHIVFSQLSHLVCYEQAKNQAKNCYVYRVFTTFTSGLLWTG